MAGEGSSVVKGATQEHSTQCKAVGDPMRCYCGPTEEEVQFLDRKDWPYEIAVVNKNDLALLVAVALGTVDRRRKRRQSMMPVGEESMPLDLIESVARKYER